MARVGVPEQIEVLGRPAIYCKDLAEWRAWLGKNHATVKEIWLVEFKKATGKPSIELVEAQDEAMRWGWVESRLKSVDNERYMYRFTPRIKGGVWSEGSIRRAQELIADKTMEPAGRMAFEGRSTEMIPDKIDMPSDLEEAFKADPSARTNFDRFPPSHKKHYYFWINETKNPETRARRVEQVLKRAAENRRMGE